jgi:hypothetical protein
MQSDAASHNQMAGMPAMRERQLRRKTNVPQKVAPTLRLIRAPSTRAGAMRGVQKFQR